MSKLPLFEARTSVGGKIETEVVAVFQDSKKKTPLPASGEWGDQIERLKKTEAFVGKSGSLQFLRFADLKNTENTLFVGLGAAEELSEEKFRVLGGSVWSKLVAEKTKTAVIQLDSFFETKGASVQQAHSRVVRAFAEGLILGAYQVNHHRSGTRDSDHGPSHFVFLTREKSLKLQLDHELKQVQAIGKSVQVTRDWSNEPSNYGTPTYYANQAKKLAEAYGLKCRILTEKEAAREKMGLFLGVGQGSEQENRFVIVEYTPKKAKKYKTVALVGKGVTFDSGGISIKPSARMEEMKHDMTGAATVMGAVLLAAQWEISNRVLGIMAFTENMPDGNAIQPGNVLTARNGKTVEVINTDAEGRLILADALDYAQDLKPDAIVDIATLTGAVSIALGKHCCAVLGNDESLIESLRRAGEANHERMWQLPLFDEYFEDLKSDYADMKNSANDSNGGTIRGAIFLKQFIRKGTQWAHLDIASTAYNLTHLSYFPKKGANGIYVRTLAQFAADY